MRSLSLAARTAINAQTTDECFIQLVTITSDALTTPILVADDAFEVLPTAGVRGVLSRGSEFIYLPFTLSMPNDDDTGIGRAQISIENVSRQIIQAILSTSGQIDIKVEVVLASDVDVVEYVLDNFILESVNFDALTITGQMTIQYYDREPFPCKRFTPSDFGGLF